MELASAGGRLPLHAFLLVCELSVHAQEPAVQGKYASESCGCGKSGFQITIRNGFIEGPDFKCELYSCSEQESVRKGTDCPRPAKLNPGREVRGFSPGSGMAAYGATCAYSGGMSKTGLLVLDMGADPMALQLPGKQWMSFFSCLPGTNNPSNTAEPCRIKGASSKPAPATSVPEEDGTIDESSVGQAVQLLKTALECPSAPTSPDPNTKQKVVLKSLGDRRILVIEEDHQEFRKQPVKGFSEVAERQSAKTIRSANLAVLQAPSLREDTVEDTVHVDCIDSLPCVSEFLESRIECQEFDDGTEKCDPNELGHQAIGSNTSLDLYAICPSQAKNVQLGLQILVRGAKQFKPAGEAYHVTGLPFLYAIPIRSTADKDSPIVGSLPKESGAVFVSNCRSVPGYKSQWCQIDWGGIKGWVSMAKLAPIAER